MYLSATETPICYSDSEFNWVGFAQTIIHDFQNTVLSSHSAFSSTNATEIAAEYRCCLH